MIGDEVVSVTSAHKPGDPGATFAVTWIDLPSDMELEGMIDWIYATVSDEIQFFSQGSTQVAGQEGYVMYYQRHWDGTWLEFQDVWMEKSKVVYCCRSTPRIYLGNAENIDLILDSFKLK